MIGRTFVELADTLDERFDLLDFLHGFAVRAVEVLDVAGAGVLLAGARGQLEVMTASSEPVRLLVLDEERRGSGPGREAHRSGQVVGERDLAGAGTRWPGFGEAALAAGFRSVYALPMRLRAERLGVLELFAGVPDGLSAEGQALGQAMADVATIGILQQRALRERRVLADQLTDALESRVLLEQAKGVLAEQGGVAVDLGFDRMRRYARDRNLKLAAVARRVVARELSYHDLVGR